MKNEFLFDITKKEIITFLGFINLKSIKIKETEGIFAKTNFLLKKEIIAMSLKSSTSIYEVIDLPFESFLWLKQDHDRTIKVNVEYLINTLFLIHYIKDQPLILDPFRGYMFKFDVNYNAKNDEARVEIFLYTEAEWIRNKKAWDSSMYYQGIQVFLEKPHLALG